jgi:VanZ family protein
MRLRRRFVVDGFALLSLAAAFLATHLPPDALKALAREGRERDVALPDAVWADDKVVHVLLYVPAGFWCALSVALRGRLDARGAALVVAFLGAFSAADELSQVLLDRVADPMDVAANLFGAAIGLAPVLLVARLLRG